MGDGTRLSLIANLSPRAIAGPPAEVTGTIIWGSATGGQMPPWSVLWRIGGW
jgi:maltooligosyltrehalose trehalohydrolase